MQLIDWFAGGERRYMTLTHCMSHDTFWITVTILLDLSVAAGYGLIALHWWTNQRRLPAESPARRALGRMRNIFVFCGLCGYLFIPIKMVWPAWRLYDLFMVVLAYSTWRYAWSARDLRVVYNELHRSGQLAQHLEESRAESRRKSEFLNAISHDLKTPLNGLGVCATLAEEQLAQNDTEGLRDSLAEIRAGVRSAAELLDYFLEVGRLDAAADPVRPTTFPLRDCLESVAARLRPLAESKGLAFRVDVPSGPPVFTDRLRLERILQNLLENAVKYTTRGQISLSAELRCPAWHVVVSDTGRGIATEHLSRIFDEFYQVENRERDRTKGFGLGLAIARRLAHQLGGDLRAESAVGRGSRFELVLPADSGAGALPVGQALRRTGVSAAPFARPPG